MTKSLSSVVPVAFGVVSGVLLHVMQLFSVPLLHGLLLLLWGGFFSAIYAYVWRHSERHKYFLSLALALMFASYALLIVIEDPLIRLFLVIFTGGLFVSLTRMFWTRATFSTPELKAQRRTMMIYWVYAMYGLTASFFALGLFFPLIPFWLISLVIGVLFGLVSVMIWRMYYEQLPISQFFLWFIVVALVMMEIVWVMHLLPFGYLASAVFVVWPWYIGQLLTRFHFSSRGIEWNQQLVFLILNVIAYILLFFVVRWV